MVGISSVWDVVPDDGDLYREVFQEHFGNTNLQVIAVFKVSILPDSSSRLRPAVAMQWSVAANARGKSCVNMLRTSETVIYAVSPLMWLNDSCRR